ncbi:MAG: carboxypeptidase regulatory-like domain-containing protein [Blastocatellia bacterium]|nr:carboxypeptidase regulatory-like domain-containing protein [Blastocatellia bacterium]
MWKYFLALPFLLLSFIAAQASYKTILEPIIKVDEEKTVFSLDEQFPNVELSITNSLGCDLEGLVKIELVDPENEIKASVSEYQKICVGNNAIKLKLPIFTEDLLQNPTIIYYRLRYSVFTEPLKLQSVVAKHLQTSIFVDTVNKSTTNYKGIIALSKLLPDLFELKLVSSEYIREKSRYQIHAIALHPITQQAINNVLIDGEIALDNTTVKSSCTTAIDGHGLLYFDLPEKINFLDSEVKVTAKLGKFSQTLTKAIRFDQVIYTYINTDKPIYQPGESLNLRVLILKSNKQALANEAVKIKINAPGGANLFRQELKTSKFGIVNTNWLIPANLELGDYRIEVELNDDKYHLLSSEQNVKISRYELPNFAVYIKTDQAYYLPKQNPRITINAQYLFGKSLNKGTVKIINLDSGIIEDPDYQGELDNLGQFTTTIDLSGEEDFEDYYKAYNDLDFIAYVTDTSTNRTEQKRFTLRLSKSDIHIYLIHQSATEGLPVEFYLSAFYADGRPAECNISLYKLDEQIKDKKENNEIINLLKNPLLTTKTNQYGVAKVVDKNLLKYLQEDNEICFVAQDEFGKVGFRKNYFYISSSEVGLHTFTNKTIYKAGEAVELEIVANKAEMLLVVDVVKDLKVIHSQTLELNQGKANLTLPYNQTFSGVITLVIYSIKENEGSKHSFPSSIKTIIYPDNKNLELSLKLDKESYRPAEEVKATLEVKTQDKQVLESALGITIFDKAVEERAQEDKNYRPNSFYQTYLHASNNYENISGITLDNLKTLDMSKPISQDLDLVAEILLANTNIYFPVITETNRFSASYSRLFASVIEKDLKEIKETLESQYAKNSLYPTNEPTLFVLLGYFGDYFYQLKDPWGTNYKVKFFVKAEMDVMEIVTAGADKIFDTTDDFVALNMGWPYFKPYGEVLNQVVSSYPTKTGDCICDSAILKREILKRGINLDTLLDPWGNLYKVDFEIHKTNYLVKIISGGKSTKEEILVWQAKANYFAYFQGVIQKALDNNLEKTGNFPKTIDELQSILKNVQVDLSKIKDPWGNNYQVDFQVENQILSFPYIVTYLEEGERKTKTDTKVKIGSKLKIYINSIGKDALAKTIDDFQVTHFSYLLNTNDLMESPIPIGTNYKPIFSDLELKGLLKGLVTDETGAVIPGASIKATNFLTSLVYQTTTNEIGEYLLIGLPAGIYTVEAFAAGFLDISNQNVIIKETFITALDIAMRPGGQSDIVEVSAQENLVSISTTDTSVNVELSKNLLSLTSRNSSNQITTPRIREYFPENLFWQPELVTNTDGQAKVKFKLADNITNWKMSVIASTTDGQIAINEVEIPAFQPFFVELDPPARLTEGDEIGLPIILRNFLEESQSITMQISEQTWFSTNDQLKRSIKVEAGDFTKEIFNFRANVPIEKGEQQISVTGTQNDAIKKLITVLPNGAEVVEYISSILTEQTIFELDIPKEALTVGKQTELKIYPNLSAHLLESLEAILQRPYGCGEQTISSTYPNLLFLRYLKDSKQVMDKTQQKAINYLNLGYNRLLSYYNKDGGFSYWGNDPSDLALTAYALEFLTDAKEIIFVNEDLIKDNLDWLLSQQNDNGSWQPKELGVNESKYFALQTALITKALAKIVDKNNESEIAKLNKALNYLEKTALDEPYLLACYAQAASHLGDKTKSLQAINKLRKLSKSSKKGYSWAINGYTPFYGWGLTGEIETTAIVLQSLIEQTDISNKGELLKDQTVNQTLLFLLNNKDRYGVWLSSQATINVLKAMMSIISQAENNINNKAEIYVNNKLAKIIKLPLINEIANPINLDLTEFITEARNKIEIRQAQGSSQIVSKYYLPWEIYNLQSKDSENKELLFFVDFDKTNSIVNEDITCLVKVGRYSQNSQGMLLAEIGLPPGVSLERADLEKAKKDLNGQFSHYDILPDRLVVYLWPSKNTALDFSFRFSGRFAINALNTRSVLYDYYNPEANVTIAPIRFVINNID